MNIRRWIDLLRSTLIRQQKPGPNRNRCRPALELLEERITHTGQKVAYLVAGLGGQNSVPGGVFPAAALGDSQID